MCDLLSNKVKELTSDQLCCLWNEFEAVSKDYFVNLEATQPPVKTQHILSYHLFALDTCNKVYFQWY